jgi:hypothetical protein
LYKKRQGFWTEEEDAILLECFGKMPCKQLALKLPNRTLSAINNRATYLELHKPWPKSIAKLRYEERIRRAAERAGLRFIDVMHARDREHTAIRQAVWRRLYREGHRVVTIARAAGKDHSTVSEAVGNVKRRDREKLSAGLGDGRT